MFDQVRIILIHPTHPGNIGAVARAMKNMGFRRLVLVRPKEFPSSQAESLASGANDILAEAQVLDSFEDAIFDCHWVFGVSARLRKIPWTLMEARAVAEFVRSACEKNGKLEIAFVFGQEQFGLTTEQLEKCQYQVVIPANPDFSSLNLAQAVQVVCYELRMSLNALAERVEGTVEDKISIQELEGFYTHLETVLKNIDFLKLEQSPYLMSRLRLLFNRSHLDKVELNILRGILTAVQKSIK